MSPEAKLRISIAPKPAITDEDLSDFHSAAKGENAGQDLAYFLPRTMESVANGHELSAGLFSLFSTYFPPVWPTLRHEEQTAVNDFYATLTRWLLTADESDKRVLPISDVIEMCASGGFDVEPIFSVLANPPITSTTINALSQLILYGAHLWQNEKNSFFEVPQDRAEQIARSLANSLSSPEVLSLLETAALQDDDEALADLASTAHVIMESIAT